MIAASPSHPSQRAFEIVLEVIVTLMMPLFMGGTTYNTDPDLARTAAIEMLNCFRPHDAWEFTGRSVQISGFGLAALGSLGLSMQPGLSLPLCLRLRSNANSLHRSGNQARIALDAYRVNYPETGPRELTPQMAEALAASVNEARRLSAQAEAMLRGSAQPSPQTPLRQPLGTEAQMPSQSCARKPRRPPCAPAHRSNLPRLEPRARPELIRRPALRRPPRSPLTGPPWGRRPKLSSTTRR